ncbi:V-type ATP synthase alpha chain [bioreactor metagenome]|uniref:V-type ATP synthase alpha chain n=1 Tax=bioreactor metagenome TaxID=1076179 RepID=A0A645DJH8_9ZZZZ
MRVFWALDTKLRERRHFPAINWLTSYSLYNKQLSQWYSDEVAADFPALREWAMLTLQKESELQEIVQLVGSDALPDEQKATLEVSKMIREIFLQQNAYHPVDTYSPMSRQYVMLKLIRKYADLSAKAVRAGVPLDKFVSIPARQRFIRAKLETNIDAELKAVGEDMDAQFKALGV